MHSYHLLFHSITYYFAFSLSSEISSSIFTPLYFFCSGFSCVALMAIGFSSLPNGFIAGGLMISLETLGLDCCSTWVDKLLTEIKQLHFLHILQQQSSIECAFCSEILVQLSIPNGCRYPKPSPSTIAMLAFKLKSTIMALKINGKNFALMWMGRKNILVMYFTFYLSRHLANNQL